MINKKNVETDKQISMFPKKYEPPKEKKKVFFSKKEKDSIRKESFKQNKESIRKKHLKEKMKFVAKRNKILDKNKVRVYLLNEKNEKIENKLRFPEAISKLENQIEEIQLRIILEKEDCQKCIENLEAINASRIDYKTKHIRQMNINHLRKESKDKLEKIKQFNIYLVFSLSEKIRLIEKIESKLSRLLASQKLHFEYYTEKDDLEIVVKNKKDINSDSNILGRYYEKLIEAKELKRDLLNTNLITKQEEGEICQS